MNKKIFFLIILLMFIIQPKLTLADQYKFYEAEYIPGIYMNKYEYKTGTIYYQQARFFRNQKTDAEVYCIEPFNFFDEHSFYETTTTPRDISSEQIKRIKQIAYFGYKYKDHIDPAWYAVTQLMIWKTAFPNNGDYYFTNTLNGNRISNYDSWIEEIENLINNYKKPLSVNNKTFTLVEDHSLIINENKNLVDYYTDNNEITINENTITINALKEGNYNITINKNINRQEKPSLIYEAPKSQNMLIRGEIEIDPILFSINVIKTKITIVKEDEDNILSQGEASLDGSIFNIYDENNNLVNEVEIVDGKVEIENLDFGKYYIKEKEPGLGYLLNENNYSFEITEDNNIQTIIIKNKVIEKKIKIIKSYGEENNYLPEENIEFEVYDTNDILIQTLITNAKGEVETTLPYGTYIIKQINTTEGYSSNEDITIAVNDTNEEIIELLDYKIKVPNTHKNNIINTLIELLLSLC